MTTVTSHWAEIEAEHAAILELLSRARLLATQSRFSASAVVPTYEAVVGKFEEHFANEERLMAATKYPDAEAHRRHHQILLIRLHSICERMKATQFVEFGQLELIFRSLLDDAIGADADLRDHLEWHA